ncbi:MAG: 30S ribosomal protein S20 [bacterium]|nr:30S ribosomal protein S20 [bacterium]
MCPITKSAKKALRQSLRKKARNVLKMKKLRKLLKEVKTLVTRAQAKREDKQSSSPSQKIDEAKKLLPKVYKLLDKAAKTGLIKKNTASRKKARITKLINKS